MSGICGLYAFDDRPLPPDSLARGMAALRACPGDAAAVHFPAPWVAFGHRALHVTPESRYEVLPFTSPRGLLSITSDARIDNRRDLLEALGTNDAADSRLILLAYEKWGFDCPRHLLGDFAFALWDGRRRCLFCARDGLGVRPFYHAPVRGGFAFSSDVACLLALGVPHRLDLSFARAQLGWAQLYSHAERTWIHAVGKIPPGHSLVVDAGAAARAPRLIRWWEPEHVPHVRHACDADYAEHVRAVLSTAVECRTRSAFPVGAHLSGGLDSSSVAVLAARELRCRGAEITAYSWSPSPAQMEREKTIDERDRIEAVREAERIEVVYDSSTLNDYMEVATRDFTVRPVSTLFREEAASRDAEARGIRTMLSGWGGDELISFNGRGWFSDQMRKGRWRTLLREMLDPNPRRWPGQAKMLFERGLVPILRDLLPALFFLFEHRPGRMPDFVRPGFRAALGAATPLPYVPVDERPGVRNMKLRLVNHGHLTQRLESWADHGAHHGFCHAFPLLDRRLVELALGLPDHLARRGMWGRYLFRLACDGILPDAVRWERSKGDQAMSRDGRACRPARFARLRDAIREQGNRELIWPEMLVAALDRLQAPRPGRVPDAHARTALLAANLAFVSPEATF